MAGSTLRSLCLLSLSLGVCLAGITVKVSPKVDVILGETARLPCSYTISDNSVQPVVQWFIDSAGTRKRIAYRSPTESGLEKISQFKDRVIMEPDMTLVISKTNVEDEMSFFCQVRGGAVGVEEDETQLRVFFSPEKPVVTDNTRNIFASQDQSSEVGKCTSRNGHPQPRIIWFKDSKPLPEVTDSKEKTYMVPRVVKESSGLFTVASTLFMRPTKEDAKSVFHCTVEYAMPNGQIRKESSDHFNLTVYYPAENVDFTLVNQGPIKEGDRVQMKCETDGNPQPQFEFYKGDVKLGHTDTGLLALEKVTRSDAGTYRCEALDFEASVDLTRTLAFKVHHLDPVSVEPAGPLTLKGGDALDLQCQTKSADPFTLVWMKGGKELSQTGGLSLQSVTLADAGEYVCVASVPTVPGLEKQANITVRVEGKPEIDVPVKVEVNKRGDEVTLRCSALGYPAPQFTWKPSGKESVTVEGQKTISTITLKATEAVINDGVTCEATNKFGTDTKKFEVAESVNTVDGDNNRGQGSPVFAKAELQHAGSSVVVIAVVVSVLLLLFIVAFLYFLSKKGNMPCGKKDNAPGNGQGEVVKKENLLDKEQDV
ncbi:basal cell adhesion molecule isoform X2 [Colossoma macropomum]|uniref:basal cell adhesion molecule isoform X2 n=1 Tax=Colossoma macropomum TaxID=42526 RepID=UPI001864E1CE|nr:basal cell adhesion molecule isoform X2 [Colossoma macropomum]